MLCVLLTLCVSPALFAQDICNARVVDKAGVFASGMSEVENAANELARAGADVRVWAVTTIGSAGTLDKLEKNIESQCPSWTSPGGNRKNNLVVLMVAVQDRKTGLYFGSEWNDALKPHWARINTKIMGPHFRSGDFAGGFAKGLAEIKRLVNASVAPPPPPPTPQPQQASPTVVVVEKATAPTDFTGLWTVMGWVVALGAIAFGAFVFFRLRKHTEQRRAAQQRALLARQGAASRIIELPPQVDLANALVEALAKKVSVDDVDSLWKKIADAQKRIASATAKYEDAGHMAGDPERPRLSEDEYGTIEETYKQILAPLQEASMLLGEVDDARAALEHAIEKAPAAVEQAVKALADAAASIAAVQAEGFKTAGADEKLAQGYAALKEAQESLAAKRFADCGIKAVLVHEFSTAAAAIAQALPQKREQAASTLAELEKRIDGSHSLIQNGREAFGRISKAFAPASWESVKGNGTEATKRFNWAAQAVAQARDLASMENQNWEGVENIVRKANESLDESDSFMRSISTREKNLEEARTQAPLDVGDAKRDVEQAWGFIKKFDDDIGDAPEVALREAEKNIQTAEEELAKNLPDFPTALTLARKAHEISDKAFGKARSERETAQRLRQEAANAMRDAERTISKAAEYIEDHRSHIGRSAKDQLDEARKFMRQAQGAVDLKTQAAFATKAESHADKGYNKARDDVRSVEASKRRDTTWDTPSVIVFDSGSNRSGGGGSFDFGGGNDGGGGGSSDW